MYFILDKGNNLKYNQNKIMGGDIVPKVVRYKNLRAAMTEIGLNKAEMARVLGMKYDTLLYKFREGEFTHEEAKTINAVFFKKKTLEEFFELFER